MNDHKYFMENYMLHLPFIKNRHAMQWTWKGSESYHLLLSYWAYFI